MTVRLVDGGMGHELRRRSRLPVHSVWAARQILEEPMVVRQVHEEFLRAGADIISTNTSAITRRKMNVFGLADRFAEVNIAACTLADRAREKINPAALIAGILPPINVRDDPWQMPPLRLMEAEYAEHALLLAPHVDILVCDSMWTSGQAFAAASAAAATGRPIWVAFTLREAGPPRLRGGETVSDAVNALAGLPIAAFLLTCTAPNAMITALAELSCCALDVDIGVRANGYREVPGEWDSTKEVDAIIVREEIGPDAYAGYAEQWISGGARIVGGCTKVGPAHIARLRTMLEAAR
ncbi:homocysteine S-methyltransferase family protein [Acuticoccus kandeliae]|uniref:homocysteine S-methyltransferase family protein n=1 Tax=Acuticoccus kandeliae TaxID=2073160 RepID=UPI000D3E794D|nr:homocysteine S-methyltransferase family protein [Acuticoccus kandeliae]